MSVSVLGITRNIIAKIGEVSSKERASLLARASASEDMQVWAFFHPAPLDQKPGHWRIWSKERVDWSLQDVHKGPFESPASVFDW